MIGRGLIPKECLNILEYSSRYIEPIELFTVLLLFAQEVKHFFLTFLGNCVKSACFVFCDTV
jgi:hypothetical protein